MHDTPCTCLICFFATVDGMTAAILNELARQITDPAVDIAAELTRPLWVAIPDIEERARLVERAADRIAVELMQRN